MPDYKAIANAHATRMKVAKRVGEIMADILVHRDSRPHDDAWKSRLLDLQELAQRARMEFDRASALYDALRSPPPPGSVWYVTGTGTTGNVMGRATCLAGPWSDPAHAIETMDAIRAAVVREFPQEGPHVIYGVSASPSTTMRPAMTMIDPAGSRTDPANWTLTK